MTFSTMSLRIPVPTGSLPVEARLLSPILTSAAGSSYGSIWRTSFRASRRHGSTGSFGSLGIPSRSPICSPPCPPRGRRRSSGPRCDPPRRSRQRSNGIDDWGSVWPTPTFRRERRHRHRWPTLPLSAWTNGSRDSPRKFPRGTHGTPMMLCFPGRSKRRSG